MAVFSSTQNTTAWEGGLRYNPMTSAPLASNSGSLGPMYRSKRCVCKPCLAQTRATIICDTLSALPSLRLLQCVEPSVGLLRPGKDPGFDLSFILCRKSLSMARIKSAQTIRTKASPPPIDIVGRARQLLADRLPTQTIIQHDHQPRTRHIGRGRNLRSCQRFQYAPL